MNEPGFFQRVGAFLLSEWHDVQASFLANYDQLLSALWETLFMVFFATVFSFVIGFLLACVMISIGPHGLRPRRSAYAALDLVVDLLRSTPFIILIIAIMPLTRLVMGTTIGTAATILPLTIAAAPFAARLIEANFLEVDRGVVEAARSFGATSFQIIFRVMLPEALPYPHRGQPDRLLGHGRHRWRRRLGRLGLPGGVHPVSGRRGAVVRAGAGDSGADHPDDRQRPV